MLTRANIAYNLHKTPHLQKVGYTDQEVIYHFSSELYRAKFEARLTENRATINQSLSNRFGVVIHSDLMADVRLYASIEKRGFLITVDGVKIECQEHITLDGLRATIKTSDGR